MSNTIYFYLLFFCGILCQGILATLSDKDTRLSSNFLSRKRRVINHMPGGRSAIRMQDVNYIVRIREDNRYICAGAILSHYTVITAALCLTRHPYVTYTIVSGSTTNRDYILHHVTSISLHSGNPPYQPLDGIVLLTVDPLFPHNAKTGSIELYEGPSLPKGTMVKVFGWGYIYPLQPGSELRQKLRAITLPIMNQAECQHSFSEQLNVTAKHICTYHAEQHCARNDEGAPLVFENKLVGIHILKEEYEHQKNPDIFINLQRPEYREWIKNNTLLI